MKKTNSQISKLYIATQPTQSSDPLKQFKQICDATNVSLNVSYNKQDSTYFCNDGETTSTITGRTLSLSVSIDYDPESESHKYLKGLIIGAATACNNQYIKLEVLIDSTATWSKLEGKACIQFKSLPPSGGATDLAKLEFDIFPQDKKWTWGTV